MNTETRTRYPGLASFSTTQKDIFFGRRKEIRELFHLLSVERTVVLFSKSGYGKTSLLQAGIIPILYGQMFVPVLIRFGTDNFLPEQHFSIQFDTAWLKFQFGNESEAQKQARDSSTSETFWEQISRCPFGSEPAQFTPLLIFDQFEELFTLYPDKEHRKRFVNELSDLIHERIPATLQDRILAELASGKISDEEAALLEKTPPMRFMFAIRSDMLHYMDELSEQIPYILRSRYQLFGLTEEQALDAIASPAEILEDTFASPPFTYSQEALQQILEVLTKNREIESFQLQAVCQALEEKIILHCLQSPQKYSQHKLEITPDFYGGEAGIDGIIEENYIRRIESLAKYNEDWPTEARNLLENILVNKNNRRQSIDVVELNVPPALLAELERQRLLRKEPRLDSFYYEISHDTWLLPIIKGRKRTLFEADLLKDAIVLKNKMYVYVAIAVLAIVINFALHYFYFAQTKIAEYNAEAVGQKQIEVLWEKKYRLEGDLNKSFKTVEELSDTSAKGDATQSLYILMQELELTDSLLGVKDNVVIESSVSILTDADALGKGKLIYSNLCAACHGQNGEGLVGPNLTDEYWIHGGGIKDLFKTIKYGVPDKGMIAWSSQLKPTDMLKVASYILTMKGTNPPNPKAPQGVIWKDEARAAQD